VDARIAVLISGTGTNLQALLDDPHVGPCVALVVSSKHGAFGLDRAARSGVPTLVVDPGDHGTREEHDAALLKVLEDASIEFVLLAGYMRILTAGFVRRFEGRMLNIHPSLLPAFPGSRPVQDALEHGAKITGLTVHFTDADVDHGPIVFQEPVLIHPDDDEESLHTRIQELEHRVYPRVARLLIEGRLKVEGRRVHVLDEGDGS
jgi:phosphoribosylglycinamide formyltransferase-1